MKKISISYYLKSPRKRDGLSLIMARIYFRGKEARISTGLYASPDYWDDETNIPIADLYNNLKSRGDSNPEGKHRLELIRREILKAKNRDPLAGDNMKRLSNSLKKVEVLSITTYDALPEKDQYNPLAVKNAIGIALNPEKEANRSLSDFFDCFENFIISGAKQKRIRTTKKYRTTLTKIHAFEKKEKYPITFENINMTFYEKFKNYLLDKGHLDDTIGKEISNIKAFMSWASERGFHKNDVFRLKTFKANITSRHTIKTLTVDQIRTLEKLDLSSKKHERLDRVRDVFLFAYYSGQRYSDVMRFDISDLDNGMWRIHQEKTKKTVPVPLGEMPEAMDILSKYDNKIPKISEQNFNKYLKEVGLLAGFTHIEKLIRHSGNKEVIKEGPFYDFMSSHMARRSRITNLLNVNKIAPAIVQHMVGHADLSTLMKYVDTKEQDLSKAFRDLKNARS